MTAAPGTWLVSIELALHSSFSWERKAMGQIGEPIRRYTVIPLEEPVAPTPERVSPPPPSRSPQPASPITSPEPQRAE